MNLIPPPVNFAGVRPPSSDFQAVRDKRRGLAFELLLDLSAARSIAARTHSVIGIGGNTIYSDPLIDASANPIGGLVVARFEDVNLNPAGAAFTIAPQFIGRIPFTQILVENPAQPGKFARLLYGTDLEFTPGINAQVTIAGTVQTVDQGIAYGASFQSTTALGANSNEVAVAPASNLAGLIVANATLTLFASATGDTGNVLLLKSSAPATMIDGDLILSNDVRAQTLAGNLGWNSVLQQRLQAATGKGLYRRAASADQALYFGLQYTLK